MKAPAKGGVDALVAYYGGLAEDQQRRDGVSRGPIDYYLDPDEPPGRWWGSGRAALGLDGEVTREQLTALLTARHPETGKPLGRGYGAKSVRGFDATFSAPKSVSVLWALSEDPFVRAETLAAHEAAVEATLAWFERHGAVTRLGTDGVDQVDACGLIVALFREHTSRTADPQLHTHAFIVAKVQDARGRWLALDARFLLQLQRALSWVYNAALRAELTTRLGVAWEPVPEGLGQADIVGVPEGLRDLFSRRSVQVEEKLAELVARWIDEHDGADPSRWVIWYLTRKAAVTSRPTKGMGVDAEALRAAWVERALEAGFDPADLSVVLDRAKPAAPFDPEDLVEQAIERVSAEASSWLRADLAREIAALLPPTAAENGEALVALVDELAEEAAWRCVELHPPALPGVARRKDGRPVSEHVTDRRLTTPAVLGQEARLLAWAKGVIEREGTHAVVVDAPHLTKAQHEAAAAMAGDADLVLVVGPAGAGKTTTLAAAVAVLVRDGRPAFGLAPSGKAADVLASEAGCASATLAKLLYEHAGPDGPAPTWALPAGATMVLDEAGTAATDDLDRLVALVRAHRWRLVCVGDPDQLPAVGRGGVFAHWCDALPAHHLEDVQRFEEAWQAAASLGLRRGDPEAAAEYAARGRVRTVQPAAAAELVARAYQALSRRGATVAITTASVETARRINRAVQHRLGTWCSGVNIRLADGSQVFAGDQVATRRNDPTLETTTGATVRNRQTWAVIAVQPDGSLLVEHPEHGAVRLPPAYVAAHVELGWAVTGYGTQGVTTDHGICVVEASSTRAGVYVGMTRGRRRNVAFVLDPTGEADPAEALAAVLQRPPRGLTAHAVRERLYAQQGLPAPTWAEEMSPGERARELLDRLTTVRSAEVEPPGLG